MQDQVSEQFRHWWKLYANVSPYLDGVRRDPRLDKFLVDIGLEELE
ncbi:MAG: hypothetical protein R3282_02625 [Rhodothermales bacterium]|nr:hypothetical protein [Rhodothermales bacterium]